MSAILDPPMVLRGTIRGVDPTNEVLDSNITIEIPFNTTQNYFDINYNNKSYNYASVKYGDWISSGPGGFALKIVSDPVVSDPDTGTITCRVRDVDGYVFTSNASSQPPNNSVTYIFRLNEDGFPQLYSSVSSNAQLEFGTSWQVDLMSHFAARNNKSQYVSINQPSAAGVTQGKDFVVGESIYIDSSGVFRKSAGSLKISDTVGIVTSKGIPSDDWFSFRPSGKYFDTTVFPNDFFPTPAIIQQVGGNNVTLTPGMKLYINPNAGRQYTTVPPASNPYATWIMISETRAIYIAGSGGGGGSGSSGGAVQVFDGGDPTWVSAPPTTIYPVLDCGGI